MTTVAANRSNIDGGTGDNLRETAARTTMVKQQQQPQPQRHYQQQHPHAMCLQHRISCNLNKQQPRSACNVGVGDGFGMVNSAVTATPMPKPSASAAWNPALKALRAACDVPNSHASSGILACRDAVLSASSWMGL